MNQPNFAPRPGKQWAIKMYPGGRMEWRQVDPSEVTYGLRAADRLMRGESIYVNNEHDAAMTWEWIKAVHDPA